MKNLITDSGYVTLAGLRAGLVDRFIVDDDNHASITMSDMIDVTVVRNGIAAVTPFHWSQINGARKLYTKARRILASKVRVLV